MKLQYVQKKYILTLSENLGCIQHYQFDTSC